MIRFKSFNDSTNEWNISIIIQVNKIGTNNDIKKNIHMISD